MPGHEEQSPGPVGKRHRRGGLGRGLESLIPTSSAASAGNDTHHPDDGVSGVRSAKVSEIRPNPYQPRTHMDRDRLEHLAQSIRTHGIMQPLIVSEDPAGNGYVLVAGERRLRAALLSGLDNVPVIVRNTAGQEMLELAIVENVVRADLSPLEEALAYRQLIDDFGLTQANVADRVGRSRVSVTNTLRLLGAPDRVREALAAGQISEGHTRAIIGLPNAIDQVAILDDVLRRGLNVRQTEELVRLWLTTHKDDKRGPKPRDAEEVRIEDRLRAALGTRVALRRSASGAASSLTIQFYSEEQLQSFYDKIVGEDLW